MDKFINPNAKLKYHTESDIQSSLNSKNLIDIENDICHLKTLSLVEHRNIARRIHKNLLIQIELSSNDQEREELFMLAQLIKMKVKLK
jgi:hypothetical protein